MHIRRLASDDWALYRSVRLAALTESPEPFGATAGEEAMLADEAWQQRLARRIQLIAEHEGVAAGTVGVVDEGDGMAEVVSMWVAPTWRGRGVGDALVAAALEAAGELRPHTIRLWVAVGNSHAPALYRRHGFAATGRRQAVRDGEPLDDRMEEEMVLEKNRLDEGDGGLA